MMNRTKNVHWTELLMGALLIIIAIVIFMNPVENFFAVTWFIGLLIVILGLLEILFRRVRKVVLGISSGWTIALSILNIIFGILIMFNLDFGFIFFSYFFAIWFILSAVLNFFVITPVTVANKSVRIGSIILNILFVIAGFVLLLNPLLTAAAVSIIIGFSFLVNGFFYVTEAFN